MIGLKKKIRDNKYLNWILIMSNWLFQGILSADRTEKIYKILFTIIFWILFYFLFHAIMGIVIFVNIILSFIVAHTLNWLVNSNFFTLIIHRLMLIKLSKKKLLDYIDTFKQRNKSQKWILYAVLFGSICRGKLKDTSDLDISIVRKPGFNNALSSLWFALKEKKIADFKGIPLEIYISDSPQDSIKRFGGEKNPVVLLDPKNTIDKYYTEKLSLSEAKQLNS